MNHKQGNLFVLVYFNDALSDEDMMLPLLDCVCDAKVRLNKREEEEIRLIQFLV